jgi:DNA-binding NarL/FixJ family response regulator
MAICVFVVDKQPVFCAGIRAILAATDDLQLIGEANNLHQLYVYKIEDPPDILLIAADLATDSLLETITTWKQKFVGSKILIMIDTDEDSVRQLSKQGIDGCILKSDSQRSFTQAIRIVANGERWFSRTLLQKTLEVELIDDSMGSIQEITEQDKAMLRLVCAAKSNPEIALALHMAERTVCRHLEEIYIKLGVCSRIGAAVEATKMGLA